MPAPKVWIAKRDQFSVVKDENPERAVTEFGRKFGKRGNITLSENVRDGEMLRFERGCRMLKGTFAVVLKQAQIWEDNDSVNNIAKAAADKAPSTVQYLNALSYLDSMESSKDIIVDLRDDNESPIMGHTKGSLLKWVTKAKQHAIYVRKSKEEAWKKLDEYQQGLQTRQFIVMLAKLLPKYIRAEVTSMVISSDVDSVRAKYVKLTDAMQRVLVENGKLIKKLNVLCSMYADILNLPSNVSDDSGTTGFGGYAIKAGGILKKLLNRLYANSKLAMSNSKSKDSRDEWEFRSEIIKGYRNGVHKLKASDLGRLVSTLESYFGTRGNVVHASTVTAADVLSDRVASIVFGDIKRIRSTIASWQGKMKPNEYKEFVDYEKSVAKFIKDKFVQRLPQTYKDKLAKL